MSDRVCIDEGRVWCVLQRCDIEVAECFSCAQFTGVDKDRTVLSCKPPLFATAAAASGAAALRS